MASNYLTDSLSPSFADKVVTDFALPAAGNSPFLDSYLQKFPTVSEKTQAIYENGLQGLDSLDGMFPDTAVTPTTPPPASAPPAWTFITAPEDISWDIANQANRVDIFGTNNPPVVAGSRGMRDLTLSNSLVEGFVRNVTVEGKVAALESLMNYGLNSSDGFVSVPVYQVWANQKSYGGPEAYYIIKDVKIKETMRDLKGNSTRAYVDISLLQVPAYQVNTGRDQASQTTAGAPAIKQAQTAGTSGAAAQAAAANQVKNKNPGAATPAGPNAGGSAKPAAPATPPKSSVTPLYPNQRPEILPAPARP